MQQEEYIIKIMQCIDEVHPDSQNDILATYSIDRFLDEAVVEISKIAPKYCLTNRISFNDSKIEDLGDGTGRVKIPEGFVRLTKFRMDGWHKEANDNITPDHKFYYKKTNRVSGGGVAKPVVVLDGEYLYYYSLPADKRHILKTAEAIVIQGAKESFSELVADCVVWLAAHKILTISGEIDSANQAKDQFAYKLSIL